MKKKIIPRKDHEVYFIPMPEGLKKKQVRPFVTGQLDRLHPAFSVAFVFDLKEIVFAKSRWIMITVMDSEILAEYKILYRGAALFTNTSIAAHKKEFVESGINVFDDEKIGFDAEKNEPVSVPMETDETILPPVTESCLKAVSVRQGIFVNNIPRRRVAAMSTISLVMVLVSSIFILTANKTGEILHLPIYAETRPEMKYMPPAVEILAKVSFDVFMAGGKITRWKYNEDSDPFMEIHLRGMDVLAVHDVCGKYEYAHLQDIQDVNYDDEDPVVTVYLNAAKAGYTTLKAGAFSAQSSTLPMIADLSNFLRQQDIIVVSESLPAGNNGYIFYTITYTAKDWNLVRSLEIISDTCDRYLLRVKKMDVSIGSSHDRFSVICTLSHSGVPDPIRTGPENEMEKIPLAFGYKENSYPLSYNVNSAEEKTEPPLIGSIRDERGQMLFYRDIDTGKILIRGNND